MTQKTQQPTAVYKKFLTDIRDDLTDILGLQGQLLNKLLARGVIGPKQYKRIKVGKLNTNVAWDARPVLNFSEK